MSSWKKVLCMSLCLTTVSMSVGCDNIRNAFNSSDSASDEVITEEQATVLADSYFEGVLATLDNMKSFKFTMSVSGETQTIPVGQGGEATEDADSSTIDVRIDAVISQQAIQLKVSEASKDYQYDDNGNVISITDEMFVDESIVTAEYTYNRSYYYDIGATEEEIANIANTEKWYKVETTLEEDISVSIEETFGELPVELIKKLLATKEVKQAKEAVVAAIKDAIADEILAGHIKNGKVAYEEDFADDVNAIITFLENIDENKDTLGKVINRVLATVAPGITVEAVLGQIKAYTKMTVSEALTAIDDMLTTNYQTNLQAIKDAIVNSEIADVLFTDAFAFDAETIQVIKDWKVESLKTGEYKDVVLGDLINTFLLENGVVEAPTEGEDSVDYCAEYLALAEMALDMTLADLEIEIPSFKGINIEEIKTSFEMQFNNKYWVEAVSGAFALALEVEEFNYDTDALEYRNTLDFTLAFGIEEISDKTAVIVIPADDDCNVVTGK